MIQVLSNIIVALYLTNLFILGVVYAIPHLQTKFKVSSDTLFKVLFMTILYTLDGLLLFYLVCLYGWFMLRKEKK